MIKNYAFSGCTANLGVDPLFSFACFLLEPDFVFLFFLIARVCVVFDAIFYSLTRVNNLISRGIFLSRFTLLVKIFLPITLCSNYAYAQKKDIFLSKGEQIEITTGNLEHFSVGNKEVLKYKYLPKKGIILIKAKSLGFSDLISWNKKKQKTVYNFYITSKKEQLKKMEIAQILRGTNLITKIAGQIISVTGEINSISSYLLIKKLESLKPKNLILNVTIKEKIKNSIIEQIYNGLYENDFEFVKCSVIKTQINCDYLTQSENETVLQNFKDPFMVNFTNLNLQRERKNYLIQFKIVSIDSDQLKSRDPGLNNIQTDLKTLLQSNKAEFKSHSIFMEDQEYRANLVAHPEVNTVTGENFKVQLGGEVAFNKQTSNGETTDWKFIGLRIQGKLEFKGKNLLLKFNSFLTRSSKNGVEGPRGESAIYISLGKLTKLYSIKVNNLSSEEKGIPIFKDIPFLKNLFMSSNSTSSNKHIIVYATLVEKESRE